MAAPLVRQPPPVQPGAGWQPIEPLPIEGGRGSFVTAEPGNDRVRVAYFRAADGRLVGRAWFGPGAQGPPGHVHGGAIAAVLDEAMGAAAWLTGLIGVAAHLALDFRRMLPLGTDAVFAAWVERHEGRKVSTVADLSGDDGTLFAQARGLFVRLDPTRDRDMLRHAAEAMGRDLDEVLAALRQR